VCWRRRVRYVTEVSEQTQDAVKYVCSHKVIGRVRIKRTLNDRVWVGGMHHVPTLSTLSTPTSTSALKRGSPRTI